MTLDKEQIIKRAEKYHSPTGRVVRATKEVLETTYPKGTNLILMFVQKFIGWPYGAKNMCMDKVVDCAELWRIAFYIFLGIDIGNSSDAQYLNEKGRIVTHTFDSLPTCRPLDLVFYKTSARKKSGHVAAIFDSKRIFHSGAAENGARVNFSKITWGKRYFTSKMYVKRFLTDEQYYSVIVGGSDTTADQSFTLDRVLVWDGKPYMRGEDVKRVQRRLKELGYFKAFVGGNYGELTERAVMFFQADNKLTVDGEVGRKTITALGGIWVGK